MATDPYLHNDTLKSRMMTGLGRVTNAWGGVAVQGILTLGDISLFTFQMLRWMVTARPKRETLLPNFYSVGVLSLPVVALTGTFIGMVLAIQSFHQFKSIGMETRLGAVINMSLVRELGPVLAATMLASCRYLLRHRRRRQHGRRREPKPVSAVAQQAASALTRKHGHRPRRLCQGHWLQTPMPLTAAVGLAEKPDWPTTCNCHCAPTRSET